MVNIFIANGLCVDQNTTIDQIGFPTCSVLSPFKTFTVFWLLKVFLSWEQTFNEELIKAVSTKRQISQKTSVFGNFFSLFLSEDYVICIYKLFPFLMIFKPHPIIAIIWRYIILVLVIYSSCILWTLPWTTLRERIHNLYPTLESDFQILRVLEAISLQISTAGLWYKHLAFFQLKRNDKWWFLF